MNLGVVSTWGPGDSRGMHVDANNVSTRSNDSVSGLHAANVGVVSTSCVPRVSISDPWGSKWCALDNPYVPLMPYTKHSERSGVHGWPCRTRQCGSNVGPMWTHVVCTWIHACHRCPTQRKTTFMDWCPCHACACREGP